MLGQLFILVYAVATVTVGAIPYTSAAIIPTTLAALAKSPTKCASIETKVTPATGKKVEKRVWRDDTSVSNLGEVCNPLTLSTGTIVYKSTTVTLRSDNTAVFTPICTNGHPVTNVDRVGGAAILTAKGESWDSWLRSDTGRFGMSLTPLLYSLSSSMIICLLLTLLILDGPKRPFLQRFSITLSSIYLLVVFITATIEMRGQYRRGFLDGESLRSLMSDNIKIQILNLIFDVFLLMTQVQVLMSLFPRQKEKRLIFWIGGSLVIICQTLWGMSVFHEDLNNGPLPAFVYLFQISIAIMYAGCMFYYCVTKYRTTLHRSLVLFTGVTVLAVLAPIALFIVDIGNWWMVEWTDSVSWLTRALSIVVVWEWAQRVERQKRHQENNRVLGRQVFEDDTTYPNSSRSRKGPGSQKDDGAGIELEEINTGDDSGGTGAASAAAVENEDERDDRSINRGQEEVTPARKIFNGTPLSLSSPPSDGRFVRTLQRAWSPVVRFSDQVIELGYFGFNIRTGSSTRSRSDNVSPGEDEPSTSTQGPLPPQTVEDVETFVYPAPPRRQWRRDTDVHSRHSDSVV